MKNILIFVAMVGIGVAIWYGGQRFAAPEGHILSGVEERDGAMRYAEEGKYFSIDVAYPSRTPLWSRWNTAADTAARSAMETELMHNITQFKLNIDAERISGPEKEMLDTTGRKYVYKIAYKPYESANKQLVSYEFDIYADTGGAHPNSYYQTFVFDSEGREVKLSDLFEPGSDYLQRISKLALPTVGAQAEERLGKGSSSAIFAEGVAPREANFENFVVDGTDLVILIPPYQAAAYVTGSFVIPIPLSQFEDILRAEWK